MASLSKLIQYKGDSSITHLREGVILIEYETKLDRTFALQSYNVFQDWLDVQTESSRYLVSHQT